MQVDALLGLLDEQVPRDHLCRAVWSIIELLDTSELERRYSPLGRRGFHPKHALAVWVYGSLIGLHEASKLSRACETDAALQWLCGGGKPSAATLKRRRADHAVFFETAIAQVIALGAKAGLVDVEALAVDSVRLRAHASTKSARTAARSEKRLIELAAIDTTSMDEAQRLAHQAKVEKHEKALATCRQLGRSNIVLTSESAGLLKFPNGASAPGHRVTAVASGKTARFIIAVLIDADGHDYGKLSPASIKAREVLDSLGLRGGRRLVVAADAGFCAAADLEFANQQQDWLDVLVAVPDFEKRQGRFFGRDAFTLHDDGRATCPAGRDMHGPYDNHDGRTKWIGVECGSCQDRSRCTSGKRRTLAVDIPADRLRRSMRARLASPEGRARYNQRIATIEPVFSFIEAVMGFRRVSSRKRSTVIAEILLKVLAYNIDRLVRAMRDGKRLLCAFFHVDADHDDRGVRWI
jgi:transposase